MRKVLVPEGVRRRSEQRGAAGGRRRAGGLRAQLTSGFGERCQGGLWFDLGFYLTDCSLHPSLPLSNSFFFLPPSPFSSFSPSHHTPPSPTSFTRSLWLGSRVLTPPLLTPKSSPPVSPPPCCSLLSRTPATRTVMSTMQSWTRPLWPRHPALGAPSMLAET